MSAEEAKERLVESLKEEAKTQAQSYINDIMDDAKLTASKEAKRIVIQSIQRVATETAIENSVTVFHIESDEIKGRIIGREGRNIRALEAATGVEIVVDDTPEAIVLSAFDPVRREIARLALHQLVTDGRIHPARIEEVVSKVRKQVEEEIIETGKRTTIDLGIHGLHPELIRMIGKMKYRSSYGQNLLQHARETANLCAVMASELGLNPKKAKRAGLLHDIGKASVVFQKRLRSKPSPLELPFRHEIASLFFLKLVSPDLRPSVIDMIVAHHKSIYKDVSRTGMIDLDNEYEEDILQFHLSDFSLWVSEAIGILAELKFPGVTHETVITEEDAREAYYFALDHCRKRQKGWSQWKGLLMGADHIASAVGDFKENVPALFADPDISFYNRKGELYPLSLIDSDRTKKHTFVKAPTGAGKTDFLIKRCRGRIFYTLPFQASINAMYERILHDLGDHVEDIRLLHSISQLLIGEERITEKVLQDKFGASIKVLTPHQLASIAFGIRGYESVLFDLQGCDIIRI